ncbi:MAG: FmdB family zinc ribbon protein [Nitrospirota bacterium]|mgnify:CR=1 FL=1
MPIYEYGCEAGHRFEVTQKMTDPPLTTCQVCELPVSKLISASAISFKGSGWYVTDYSNKMKPPSADEKTAKPAESPKDGAEKPAAAASTPPAPPPAGGSTGSGSTPAPASTPGS